ncbi:hypothetical protein KP509_33G000600 [Ceratopteris richardii]|uniref:Uncharacterized protein n=1 Tax=Ceratopteris richardii TaxID=49495 RepID=A0A8T2QLQ9_CERRI|nr:hypothetical protein KP509_33G000600 [Ceratopteris richardii]
MRRERESERGTLLSMTLGRAVHRSSVRERER